MEMWNRDSRNEEETTEATPTRTSAVRATTVASSLIGPGLVIKGQLNGTENLEIRGRVEGDVSLKEHSVTVREGGSLSGTATAQDVEIEGKVNGDLEARERVILRASSDMEGKIVAARVVLEDGCRFKGMIDMDVQRGNLNVVKGGMADKAAVLSDKKPADAASDK
jgi:cytoskeletal protein CcmA (bactofilin family)